MANAAAKLFCSYMETKELNCRMVEDEDGLVRAGWRLDNTQIAVFIKFDEECTNVHIEGVDFLQVSPDKVNAMYKAVNDCNDKYRWVKFVLDAEHGQVVAKDDALIQLDTCAEETFELVIRMIQIVEDAYPIFMKAMWA